MTKINKGFTLIELLVVIAIIGVLAGILFVAINPKKQTDAAKAANIKAQLAQVPNQAVIDGDDQNGGISYDDVCEGATNTGKLLKSAWKQAGVQDSALDSKLNTDCEASTNAFAARVTFNNDNVNEYYCVDNNGLHTDKTRTVPYDLNKNENGTSVIVCN